MSNRKSFVITGFNISVPLKVKEWIKLSGMNLNPLRELGAESIKFGSLCTKRGGTIEFNVEIDFSEDTEFGYTIANKVSEKIVEMLNS